MTHLADASRHTVEGDPFADLTDPAAVLLHATPESRSATALTRPGCWAAHRHGGEPPMITRLGHTVQAIGQQLLMARIHSRSSQSQAVLIMLAVTAITAAALTTDTTLVFYWVFNAAIISICLIAYLNECWFSQFPVARGCTVAIIPAYNEPQDKLEPCVRSLLTQTVPLDRIVCGGRWLGLPGRASEAAFLDRASDQAPGVRSVRTPSRKDCSAALFPSIRQSWW